VANKKGCCGARPFYRVVAETAPATACMPQVAA